MGKTALLACVVLTLAATACSPVPPKPANSASTPATQTLEETPTSDATEVPRAEGALDTLPAAHPGIRPTKSEITAVVKKFVTRNSSGVTAKGVRDVRVALDTRGRWWVTVWAIPVNPEFDEAGLYLYKDGATWTLFELGTGIEKSELPADVRGKL